MKFGLLYELEMPKPWSRNREREVFLRDLDAALGGVLAGT